MNVAAAHRFEIRARRRRALLANHDILTDRLVGIRTAGALDYSVNLPAWW